MKKEGNGLFVMVIDGDFKIEDQLLTNRDGLGIWDTGSVTIESLSDHSRILLIDVPMA